jgi:hypothetical protein
MSKETGKKLAVTALFLACALGAYKSLTAQSEPLEQLVQKIYPSITIPVPITFGALLVSSLYVSVMNKWLYPIIAKQFIRARYSKAGMALMAAHELGHAFAAIKLDSGTIVEKVTLEPRIISDRMIGGLRDPGGACVDYKFLFNNFDELNRTQLENCIIGTLAGVEAHNSIKETPCKWRMEGLNDYMWAKKDTGYLVDRFEKAANRKERRQKINNVYAELKKRAYDLMASNKGCLEFGAQTLLKKGTLTGDEVMALIKEYESVHAPKVS